MRFLTGEDYPKLCTDCQAIITHIAHMMPELPDTDDEEAPIMHAYDHAMMCGGRSCMGKFKAGDTVVDTTTGTVLTLMELTGGGFWVAKDDMGHEWFPEPEDLTIVRYD